MSNSYSRYTKIYEKAVRFNSATPFPKHNFLRGANRRSCYKDRLGDKPSCFESTFVHLTERFNNTELFLIGTMNTSTMLARRTQKIISEINPDAVMVMTSPHWWSTARDMENIESQEEFDNYKFRFLKMREEFKVDTSYSRSVVFWLRMLALQTTLRYIYKFGYDFDFYTPGLEIKYACEEAEKIGAELHFLGPELDNVTWHRLYHETRLNIPRVIPQFAYYFVPGAPWGQELENHTKKLHLYGKSPFVEKNCDASVMSWYIKSLEKIFPFLKKAIIDQRDMALYKAITKSTNHKRIVAVVNQWHMEGIEHLWAHEFGQLPRSQPFDYIDPIGDMELKDGLFYMLFNAFQREYKSAVSRTVPASYSNLMNTYHREQNWQYEHRNM